MLKTRVSTGSCVVLILQLLERRKLIPEVHPNKTFGRGWKDHIGRLQNFGQVAPDSLYLLSFAQVALAAPF